MGQPNRPQCRTRPPSHHRRNQPQGETYIYDDFLPAHYATEEGGYYGDELPILIKDTPDGEIHTERTGCVYVDRYNMTRNTTYNLTITVPPHRIHKLGKIL